MRLGQRTFGGARLDLREPKALPAHMRGPIVEVHDLYTSPPARGQGDAATLLLQTTALADMEGVMLFLRVLPGSTTDKARLTGFYERNGFVTIQTEPLLMVRPHVGMRGNV